MARCPAHGNRIQQTPSGAVNLFGATPQPDCRRTGEVCCHLLLLRRRLRLGGIPLTGARGLCDAAIDDQVMTVVHQHMSPVAPLRWMGIGFAGQQGHSFGEDCVNRIRAGVVGLIAELDAAKVALGPLLSLSGCTESFARTCGRRRRILLAIDPLQGGV